MEHFIPMKIKIAKRKWHTASMNSRWQKLANHISSHYPKDSKLAATLRDAVKHADMAAAKLSTTAKPKRKTAVKAKTTKRRTAAKRTATPKRRTAKTTTKRRTAKSTTKRATTTRRRKAAPKRSTRSTGRRTMRRAGAR
jgi:hypothetical protein